MLDLRLTEDQRRNVAGWHAFAEDSQIQRMVIARSLPSAQSPSSLRCGHG